MLGNECLFWCVEVSLIDWEVRDLRRVFEGIVEVNALRFKPWQLGFEPFFEVGEILFGLDGPCGFGKSNKAWPCHEISAFLGRGCFCPEAGLNAKHLLFITVRELERCGKVVGLA